MGFDHIMYILYICVAIYIFRRVVGITSVSYLAYVIFCVVI